MNLQRFLASFLLTCVLLADLLLPAPLHAQSDTADYTYGECSRIDKEQVRSEIEQAAQTVLSAHSGQLSIAQLVERKWAERNIDAVIDEEVARAVNNVAQNEGYFSRLWSGWSADKAEEFATRIADDAFASARFHEKLDELATAVADEIAREIDASFAEAASAAFLCMKAYVGARYSTTLFAAFEKRVSLEIDQASVKSDVAVDVAITGVHSKALGGIGIIVVTEIARRITQKLSEKIAERVAGRIIGRVLGRAGSSLLPVAGWVIGLGLIAWDLWEGGKGALPQIQESLTSQEVKARIRSEIADSIKNGLPDETALASLEIAVTILEEWDGFCGRYPDVCALAESNPTFQAILAETPLDQLDKLALLVAVLGNYAGRAELERALASGEFEAALALPEGSYALIQPARALGPLLAWSKLAGTRLDEVLRKGIARTKTPADFSPALLAAVLSVEEQATVDKLLQLDRSELETLVAFAGRDFAGMASTMPLAEMRQLVSYLSTPPAVAVTTPEPDLAPKLASGEVTVRQLLEPAPTATDTPLPPTAVATALEQAPVQQPPVDNPIGMAIAALVVLVLAALLVIVWRRGQVQDASQERP